MEHQPHWRCVKKAEVNLVCLVFFVPLKNFSLIWRHHLCRWRAAILTYARHLWILGSEWGFFSMPQLLWHRPTLYMYNGNLSEDPQWLSLTHLLQLSFCSWAVNTCTCSNKLSSVLTRDQLQTCSQEQIDVRTHKPLLY